MKSLITLFALIPALAICQQTTLYQDSILAVRLKADSVFVNGRLGVGTTSPKTIADFSGATGSATIIPMDITITSTNSAADWATFNPWGAVSFYSNDGSGTGASVRGRIGTYMTNSAGSGSGVGIWVNNGSALIPAIWTDMNGNTILSTANPPTVASYKLDVVGTARATQYNLSALNTAPASSTATGTTGEIRVTSTYIYVCTATNTWVRSALSTF